MVTINARHGGHARRVSTRVLSRIAVLGALLIVGVLVLVSVGAAVGRFEIAPVDSEGPGVGIPHSAAAVVVPVPTLELHAGDVVTAKLDNDPHLRLYRVEAVDSWTHEVYTKNDDGRLAVLKLGTRAGRVSRIVPHVGTAWNWLAGTPQALVALALAMLLLTKATLQRRSRRPNIKPLYRRVATGMHLVASSAARERARLVKMLRSEVDRADAERRRRRLPVGGPWWWTRLFAAVAWLIGVLSLTASANFTGTAQTATQTITAAHIQLTKPGANDLTTAATNIAPGDLIERAIDIGTDASTNASGVNNLASVQLSVSTTTDTAGGGGGKLTDASGLKVWVLSCTSSWGGSYSAGYTCGGTLGDVLGTYHATAGGSTLPSAGTCPAVGTLSSLFAMNTSGSGAAVALTNMTLTTSANNHLVVFMCFPTADGDSYQDATATVVWSFAGVQRTNQFR
jgi:hypothetical protein